MTVAVTAERRDERPVFGLGGITGDFDIEADRKERSDELGGKSAVVAHNPPVAPIRSGFGANWFALKNGASLSPQHEQVQIRQLALDLGYTNVVRMDGRSNGLLVESTYRHGDFRR